MNEQASKPLIADSLIVPRPHFRQVGTDLYFFLSNRVFHTLNPAEARLWKSIQDRPVPVADAGDTETIRSLAAAHVIDVVATVSQENRRRILVVEPHCDDAALSVGATMWQLRNDVEFHLLTMASRSNYTSAFQLHRDCFKRSEISRIRASEGALFAMHFGGHYHCAGLAEATLRYANQDWNLDFFNGHEVPVAVANNRRADAATLDNWVDALRSFLQDRTFEEIWIPLGAGTHSDHDLARNASLRVLSTERPSGIIRLYEDVPYGAEFQEHTDRILKELQSSGARLTPWHRDVTEDYETKLSLLSIFASQFKVPAIEPGVEWSAGSNPRIERLWTLDVLPDPLPEEEIWIGAPEIADISRVVERFLDCSSFAKRLAIFAISASGRWRHDLEQLRALFPRAKIVIYAGPRVSAEFECTTDARVELHRLSGRTRSWVAAALREVSTGYRLMIAGDSMAKSRKVRKLWPAGKTLVVRDMDHFIHAAMRSGVSEVDGTTNQAASE